MADPVILMAGVAEIKYNITFAWQSWQMLSFLMASVAGTTFCTADSSNLHGRRGRISKDTLI
jgi:hypothetical protein